MGRYFPYMFIFLWTASMLPFFERKIPRRLSASLAAFLISRWISGLSAMYSLPTVLYGILVEQM